MKSKFKKMTQGLTWEQRMALMYEIKAKRAAQPWHNVRERNIFAECQVARNAKKYRNKVSNERAGYYAPSRIRTFRFPNSYAVSVCRTTKIL